METLEFDGYSETGLKRDILRLLEKEGALIVRAPGFDKRAFEAFTALICPRFYRVSSRESMRLETGDGFSTAAPTENFHLFSHCEAAYAPYPPTPDTGFLFCRTPPDGPGGETYLVDGIAAFRALPADLRNRFLREKIIYKMAWEPMRWQAQFHVDTETELQARLSRLDSVSWSMTGRVLNLAYTSTGIRTLPDGTQILSNAILGHLPRITHPRYRNEAVFTKTTNNVCWASGEALSSEEINQLIDVQDALKQPHVWRQDDILIFDNLRHMHGRRIWQNGSIRELYARFGHRNAAKPADTMPMQSIF